MPLAPFFVLQFYGKSTGAIVDQVVVDAELTIRAFARLGINDQISVLTELKGTLLVNSPINDQITVIGEVVAKAWARMGIDRSIEAQPTAFEITQSVLNALAADYNIPNTIGAKINASGAAGDPWAAILEGTYTAADLMRVMASILAGKTTITDLGAGNKQAKFRSVNDTEDRVTTNVNPGNERTSVTINES
jgi:hypothetical protein